MMFSIKKSVWIGFLLSFLSMSAHALEPLHYASVPAMVEDLGDFSDENGTFTLVTSNPLYVKFSPHVVPGDLSENVRYEVQRAAIYGVYRTFVHTSADAVRVTASPLEIDLKSGKSKALNMPTVDVTVTRAQALAAVNKLIPAGDFTDLVSPEQMGDMQLDNWTKGFETLYYKQPGIDKLLKELKAKQG